MLFRFVILLNIVVKVLIAAHQNNEILPFVHLYVENINFDITIRILQTLRNKINLANFRLIHFFIKTNKDI